jgi:DNA-binding NtrC family response regulator
MAKILIIDDEPSILESLEMFLGEKGHTVFKADTGEKGYALFEREDAGSGHPGYPPAGYERARSIVSNSGSGHLAKVIMMTAFQDMETTIDAMKRGAYDYIHKPLDAELVEKTVNSALHVLKVDRETPRVKGKKPFPVTKTSSSEKARICGASSK